jgi:hypothetical protein
VFDAMLSALDSFTAEAPALLVLEDLHWADRSSRDLLVFLLSRLTAQRLVVLATYRTDDLHRRHPLRSVLSELVRLPAVERLDLAPLGPGDTLDLVQRLANGSLSEELVRRAAERSEGNAFFAEELVSASSGGPARRARRGADGPHRGPAAVTQQVLRLAAVAGRRVEHDLLAAVSQLPDDELDQALRDAVAHHVLVADASDAYVFRHALLREAIYTELLPASAAGCTPATPSSSPSTARRARRPSSPTTRWPRTTCRSRWPPRCGRRGRPIAVPRPPRCCCTSSARWSCGMPCPSPSRSPA